MRTLSRDVYRAVLTAKPLMAILLAGVPGTAAAQAPAEHAQDSARVVATLQSFHAALAAGDSAAALALLTPDAVVLESGGIETLAEYRSHHLPGDVAFARAIRSERGPVSVRIRGDVAWATSTSSAVGTFRDRAIDSAGAELAVLVRDGEGWRIAAIHWSARQRRR